MSDFSIADGKGRGYEAQVDPSNRLRTFGVMERVSAHVAQYHGDYFIVSTGQIMESHTVTATGGVFLVVKNRSDSLLVIPAVGFFPDTSGMFVNPVHDPVFSSLGNAVQITPRTTHIGAPNLPEGRVEVYGWDEVGDGITGLIDGKEVGWTRVYPGTSFPGDTNETLLIRPERTIAWKVKGAGEFSMRVDMFFLPSHDASIPE